MDDAARARRAHTSVSFATLARVPPLELITVAGVMPQHEVRVFDARLETEGAFVSELRDFQPDLLGMTAYSAEAEQAKAMCRLAKSVCEGIVVVQGGYHASMAPADALNEPEVDFIVRFEAKQTLPELDAAPSAGSWWPATSGAPTGMSWRTSRPWRPRGAAPMSARSARSGCATTASIGRRAWAECWRKWSASRRPTWWVSSTTTSWVDGRRSLDLADRISANPRDWRGKARRYFAQVRISDICRTPELVARWGRAGMKVLLLGIESDKQDEVDSLHHKLTNLAHADFALRTMREHGMEAWGCFIVNPEWEAQDFDDLADSVVLHDIGFPQFRVLTPLSGTRLPLRRFYENVAQVYARTSMDANLSLYRRALRNGAINRDWLRRDLGRKVRGVFA